MNEIYHDLYINSINFGLKNSIFHLNNEYVDGNMFFISIKNQLLNLKKEKNKIYFFGNGASSAFANHMALDFSKNGKILSRSLSDSALLTALSNDYSFENAMVEFLKIEEATSNDLVITISSSGNSPNIVNVLNYCISKSIQTLSLSGLKPDNKSIKLSNYSIYVPMKTYGIVECIHQIYLHLILDHSMDICEWDRVDFQNMSSSHFKL